MTAATEKDLKRLEDLIIGIANGQKAIENRLTTMENRLTTIENGQKNLELGQSEIKGDIWTLDGKIEGLSCKRLELKYGERGGENHRSRRKSRRIEKPETDRDSGDHRFDQFGLVLGFKSYPKRQAIIIPKILWGVT